MSVEDNKQEALTPENEQPTFSTLFEEPVLPRGVKKRPKRLRSRTKTLILALAIAVATAILLTVVLLIPQNAVSPSSSVTSDVQPEAETHTLYDHSKDDTEEVLVKSVRIENSTGKYDLAYDKNKEYYHLTAYQDIPLSQNVEDLIEKCITLTAYNKVKGQLEASVVGLDKPSATVSIIYHDDSVTTIQVGAKTPTGDGYYVRLSGSNDIYMLDTDTVMYFHSADWWYVSTTLYSPPVKQEGDDSGTAVLKELHLTGRGYKYDMHIRRPTADDSDELSYFKYLTTKPYLRGVNDSVGDDLYGFTSLYASKAAILHPTAAQKEMYGFNNPMAVATVTLAIENVTTADDGDSKTAYYNHCKYTIRVGSKDTDGNYVVMMDGIDIIYLIEPDNIATLIERTHENTTTSLLFLKDITSVGKIEFTNEGTKHTFELTHYPTKENEDEKLAVYVEGKRMDTANFRKLYVLMMGLYRYDLPDSEPTGKPETIISLYDNDGRAFLSISCYNTTGSLCSVKTSDGELFSIKSGSLTNLITETKKFLNGEAVKS